MYDAPAVLSRMLCVPALYVRLELSSHRYIFLLLFNAKNYALLNIPSFIRVYAVIPTYRHLCIAL